MPERLGQDEVLRVAELARLALRPEELDEFGRQLSDILAYAEQVQAVDTTDVPPTTHALAAGNPERADRVRDSLSRTDALANAPDAAPALGLLRVPRVLE
jgi:aspartyl-tRNA(Asn)/glutamyl-tRNA(Gln) amidotransferase subunit C